MHAWQRRLIVDTKRWILYCGNRFHSSFKACSSSARVRGWTGLFYINVQGIPYVFNGIKVWAFGRPGQTLYVVIEVLNCCLCHMGTGTVLLENCSRIGVEEWQHMFSYFCLNVLIFYCLTKRNGHKPVTYRNQV